MRQPPVDPHAPPRRWGAPTTSGVADAAESLRAALRAAYGDDFSFTVRGSGGCLVAASSYKHGEVIACEASYPPLDVKVGDQYRVTSDGECFEVGQIYTVINTYAGADGSPRMDLVSELLNTTVAGVRINDKCLQAMGQTSEGTAVVARIYTRYAQNPDD